MLLEDTGKADNARSEVLYLLNACSYKILCLIVCHKNVVNKFFRIPYPPPEQFLICLGLLTQDLLDILFSFTPVGTKEGVGENPFSYQISGVRMAGGDIVVERRANLFRKLQSKIQDFRRNVVWRECCLEET